MTQPAGPTTSDQAATASDASAAEVDVQKLAEKVYRLMLADIRLAAARGARQPEPIRRKEF